MTAEGAMGYDASLLLCTLCSTGLLLYAIYLIYFQKNKKALWIAYPALMIHGLLFIMQGILADEFRYFTCCLSLPHILFAVSLWGLAHILVLAQWLRETKPQ